MSAAIVRRSERIARRSERSGSVTRLWQRIGVYLLLSVFAVVAVAPVLFMVFSSLKPQQQLLVDMQGVRGLLPVGDLSFDNYLSVFDRVPAWTFLANSIFVTVAIVVLGLIVNSMAGFALARLRFRGQALLMGLVLAVLVVPFETIAVPLLYWVVQLPWLDIAPDGVELTRGWLNSYHVQILPFVANAFSIFLFRQQFSTIPRELDEAARIDGAGWFGIYRRVIVPLSGPTFATVAILTFMPAWNQYLWPLMTIQREALRPASVGMQYFFQLEPLWGEIMAYGTLITIPMLVVFLVFQRSFVSSIAASGLKG